MRTASFASGRPVRRRRGLTLLEVLLAITILLITMQGVIELASIGSRASVDSQRQTEAATRAQTLFAELLSGVTPVTPQSLHPFADSTDWQWSLELSESEPGLTLLRLTIAHAPSRQTKYSETFQRLVRTSTIDAPPQFATQGRR